MKRLAAVLLLLFLVGCERNRLGIRMAAEETGDLILVTAGQSLADSETTSPIWSELGKVDITRQLTGEQFVPTQADPSYSYTTWISLGDFIARHNGRTTHVFNRSWGGTSTRQWRENYNGTLSRLLHTIEQQKPHAVLWMQGETDNIVGISAEESYQNMRDIIHMSARRSPQTLWYVAIEAGNVADIEGSASVQAQRRLVREGLAQTGVNVEEIRLDDSNRDVPGTGLHMSDKGNVVLAQAWFTVLKNSGLFYR
jgi:hypothetical protein